MHQTTRNIYILSKIILIISKLLSIFYVLYIVINSYFSQVSDVQRISPPDVDIILQDQCTDSGGGGTKAVLARDITSRAITHAQYRIGTCSIHNIQTGLRSAV